MSHLRGCGNDPEQEPPGTGHCQVAYQMINRVHLLYMEHFPYVDVCAIGVRGEVFSKGQSFPQIQ